MANLQNKGYGWPGIIWEMTEKRSRLIWPSCYSKATFLIENALIVDGTFSFPKCTVNQHCFLLQSLKKQVLNTVVNGHKPKVNGHKPNYKKNLQYFEQCWTKKIKMVTDFIQCASAAWYNDVNKDESLNNLLVNRKVFMLIEFYLPR